MGTRDDVLKGLELLVDGLALVDPEIGIMAREGILLAKELVEQDVPQPADQIRKLRLAVREDWRALLLQRFG